MLIEGQTRHLRTIVPRLQGLEHVQEAEESMRDIPTDSKELKFHFKCFNMFIECVGEHVRKSLLIVISNNKRLITRYSIQCS